MPPHPLTNYQNEPKYNGFYSRNNLPKIKDGAYIINLDEFKSIRTHLIAFYVNGNNRRASKIKDGAYIINLDKFKSIGTHLIAFYVNGKNRRTSNDAIYFDSFGVEYIPKEIKKSKGNKNIITNAYRIQAYDLIICRYFCIRFIDFMLNGESLLDYTNSFSPNDYENNNKIMLKYFQ